jgi:hypothetical protein
MSNENIKLLIINIFVKNLTESPKYLQNHEVVSIFEEKYESRYKIRNKLYEIFWSYLPDTELRLPLPTQKKLHKNLMNVLGYSFCIFIIISTIDMLIVKSDSVIDYDSKRNTEIMKCDTNIENGILGMKRDANLQLVKFFYSYDDMRAVLIS